MLGTSVIPEKSDLFETKRFFLVLVAREGPFGHLKAMRLLFRTLAWLFRALLSTRNDLAMENIALRPTLGLRPAKS